MLFFVSYVLVNVAKYECKPLPGRKTINLQKDNSYTNRYILYAEEERRGHSGAKIFFSRGKVIAPKKIVHYILSTLAL